MDSNRTQTTTDIWMFSETSLDAASLIGYSVEATDGSIGKVDEATDEVGRSYLVVDTGPWIFGKKVMLPAGVIERVDLDDEKVFVSRTKDEIKNAPEFDADELRDDEPTAAASAATTTGSSSADQQRRAVQVGRPSLV